MQNDGQTTGSARFHYANDDKKEANNEVSLVTRSSTLNENAMEENIVAETGGVGISNSHNSV